MDISQQFITTALDYGVAFLFGILFLFVGYRAMKWANDRAQELLALITQMQKGEDKRLEFRTQQAAENNRHNEVMARLLGSQGDTLTEIGHTMNSMVSILQTIDTDTRELPKGIARIATIHEILTDLRKAVDDVTTSVNKLIDAANGNKETFILAIDDSLEQLYERILVELKTFKRKTDELEAINTDKAI